MEASLVKTEGGIPYFPVIDSKRNKLGDEYSFSCTTAIRICDNGVWYDLICKETFVSENPDDWQMVLRLLVDKAYKTIMLGDITAINKHLEFEPSPLQMDEKERLKKIAL